MNCVYQNRLTRLDSGMELVLLTTVSYSSILGNFSSGNIVEYVRCYVYSCDKVVFYFFRKTFSDFIKDLKFFLDQNCGF